MQQLLTGQNVFDLIIALGVIAFAVGQFTIGRRAKNKDDIDTENSAMQLQGNKIKVLEAALKEQETINKKTGEDLAALKAVLIEKDKTIKEYFDIIQNRDPQLKNVLGEILDFMKKINTHMEQDLKITGTVSH